MLWNRFRQLPFSLESLELEALELETNSGYVRTTTVVGLRGAGSIGRGEEVTWDAACQSRFRRQAAELPLCGEFTLESFSRRLNDLELWPEPPPNKDWRDYRRWAFESAALDLALQQNDLGLEEAFGARIQPLCFSVSLGLQSFAAIDARLAIHADMRFKLDATADWDAELCARLAATDAVDVIDFKGAYVGTPVDVAADLGLYERVLDAMPGVIIEDPHDEDDVLALLRERAAVVSWDAPIHAMVDLERMPIAPRALNIKPSRLGTLERLFDVYQACRECGLTMYGGGQFELGVGRHQIQALAALFHPDGPNDVAPLGYHQLGHDEPRPGSPLQLQLAPVGFGLA
jgi:hypothetical protein